MSTAGHAEVEAFLASLGLEQHAHNLIYNGFYTSLDALRAADYHELLECNVRPVHARLIVSNLKGAPRRASSGSSGEAEVVSFLRSIGLENCAQQVLDAGFASLDVLGQTSMNALLEAGLKPVHARLIVSNLDSASSAGLSVAPPPRNDEDEALAPLVPPSPSPHPSPHPNPSPSPSPSPSPNPNPNPNPSSSPSSSPNPRCRSLWGRLPRRSGGATRSNACSSPRGCSCSRACPSWSTRRTSSRRPRPSSRRVASCLPAP